MVDTPNSILARRLVQRLNQGYTTNLFTVERAGNPMLKGNLDIGRAGMLYVIGIDRPGVDLFGRLGPGYSRIPHSTLRPHRF